MEKQNCEMSVFVDDQEGFNYTTSEKNLMPFYKHLAEDTNLRVLVIACPLAFMHSTYS